MSTFVVAHGAWSVGWAWKKMRPLRQRADTRFSRRLTPGSASVHILRIKDLNLDAHIKDMLAVIEYENLRDFVLVGHSYGGMVATGVADRLRGKIKHLVYLDAFAPEDGKAVHDYVPAERRDRDRDRSSAVDGWKIMPPVPPADTSPEDVAWMTPLRAPQPLECFEQKLVFKNGPLNLPRTYIYAKKHNPGDYFRQFMERGRKEGWAVYEMDASHSPHVTAPEALMEILEKVAAA